MTLKDLITLQTDIWIQKVEANNPQEITELFHTDAFLWGTVSRIVRNNSDQIKEYFDYFACIPGIKAINKTYHISKITDTVYVNNAEIHWLHNQIKKPLKARMTFIYRLHSETNQWLIFELHSSQLPDSIQYIK